VSKALLRLQQIWFVFHVSFHNHFCLFVCLFVWLVGWLLLLNKFKKKKKSFFGGLFWCAFFPFMIRFFFPPGFILVCLIFVSGCSHGIVKVVGNL